jgi:uncharacterized membrane protein
MTIAAPAPTPFQRLLSLDILRGITIAFMIMVNNNGGAGAQPDDAGEGTAGEFPDWRLFLRSRAYSAMMPGSSAVNS